MKHLIQSLQVKINQIENGNVAVVDFDAAITYSQEMLEKLYILRYKAYENEVQNKSTDTPKTEEVQCQFDLTELNNPSFEKAEISIEPDKEKDIIVDSKEESIAITEVIPEEPVIVQNLEEELFSNVTESSAQEDEIVEEFIEELKESLDIALLIRETKKPVEALDTLIGSFSLKEKLQYINQLFGGSSEVFASAVKHLDESGNMEKAESHLVYLANEYKWIQAETDVVKKIISKVYARYA